MQDAAVFARVHSLVVGPSVYAARTTERLGGWTRRGRVMAALVASATAASTFTDGQALAALLTTEGFLLAAVALSVNLGAPNQPRPRRQIVSFKALAISAGVVVAVAGIGAIFAWGRIFLGGRYEGFSRAVLAGCLLVTVIAQPVIAILLALGSRTR